MHVLVVDSHPEIREILNKSPEVVAVGDAAAAMAILATGEVRELFCGAWGLARDGKDVQDVLRLAAALKVPAAVMAFHPWALCREFGVPQVDKAEVLERFG